MAGANVIFFEHQRALRVGAGRGRGRTGLWSTVTNCAEFVVFSAFFDDTLETFFAVAETPLTRLPRVLISFGDTVGVSLGVVGLFTHLSAATAVVGGAFFEADFGGAGGA